MNFGQFPGLLCCNKVLWLHRGQKLAKDEIMSYCFTAFRALGALANFHMMVTICQARHLHELIES